ncbi:unnamed protein product [Owenia fusiformis]|uniref:G-protein coupled receptors family 1 profile domain-containing protein n=1 Tax=Owenia fusiformis TaxID=6347 RepID=A0A8S4PI43_OWEFU|nr:unnamed protein product [Owenia fusiformis]
MELTKSHIMATTLSTVSEMISENATIFATTVVSAVEMNNTTTSKIDDYKNIVNFNNTGINTTNMTTDVLNNFIQSIDDPLPDFSYEDYNYLNEMKKVGHLEMALKVFFYSIIICLALVGNTLVIFIVWRSKSMRTTTNYYIVNLAVSDILVTLCCSWVHLVDDLSEGWVLGPIFCKINSFAQVLVLVSSTLTLTLIACDRFFGVMFAMRAHMTERRASFFILAVWLSSFAIATPLLVYREQLDRQWKDHHEIWCNDAHAWPKSARMIYYCVVTLLLFFLPLGIMGVGYSLIIWRLRSTHVPGEHVSDRNYQHKVKKRVVLMLIIILVLFAVCWGPIQGYILFAEFRMQHQRPLPSWSEQFHFYASALAFSNSAVNPFIYAGFNDNFRKGFKEVFNLRIIRRRYSAFELRTESIYQSSSISRHSARTCETTNGVAGSRASSRRSGSRSQ